MKKEIKIKEPIRLRTKELLNGCYSLYLDIYINGKRKYEFLKLYIIPERSKVDKERNAETLRLANAIKAEKIVALQNGKYGFNLNKKRLNISLTDYIQYLAHRDSVKKSKKTLMNTLIYHLQRYDKKPLPYSVVPAAAPRRAGQRRRFAARALGRQQLYLLQRHAGHRPADRRDAEGEGLLHALPQRRRTLLRSPDEPETAEGAGRGRLGLCRPAGAKLRARHADAAGRPRGLSAGPHARQPRACGFTRRPCDLLHDVGPQERQPLSDSGISAHQPLRDHAGAADYELPRNGL